MPPLKRRRFPVFILYTPFMLKAGISKPTPRIASAAKYQNDPNAVAPAKAGAAAAAAISRFFMTLSIFFQAQAQRQQLVRPIGSHQSIFKPRA
jgi:hypothetical protein